MTRINLLPVTQLTDQHLIAEYRELPRIFALARRDADIPKRFVLGKGHVTFFYDKLLFLELRLKRLIDECLKRGIKIQNTDVSFNIDPALYNSYVPTRKEYLLSKSRIDDKIRQKPHWYRYYGTIID